MLQVDNVREVKLRRYRVSLKGDSEQGQRCRNSIPELRRPLMIKTSTPAHTQREIWTGAQSKAAAGGTRAMRRKLNAYFLLASFLPPPSPLP